MVNKLLFVDVETTGVDEFIHEPHQIALIVEINNKVYCEQVFYAQPINYDKICNKALEVCNITLDKIKEYPPARVTYAQFNHLLKQYVNPYDPTDKFTAVGQNVRFDMRMLDQWFRKHGNSYFYSMIDSKNEMDTLHITRIFTNIGLMPRLGDNKLVTICKELNIVIDSAHDALCDIQCTRKVFKKYMKVFNALNDLIKQGLIRVDLKHDDGE